jgi:hypothetical protein
MGFYGHSVQGKSGTAGTAAGAEVARSVVIGCGFIVVAGVLCGASSDFERITNSIAIGVGEAIARTIVSGFGEVAGTRIGSCGVVVAGCGVLAADDFEGVAYAVPVGVLEANTITIITILRIRAVN